MRTPLLSLGALLVLPGLLGCGGESARLHGSDSPVLLSILEFNGLPTQVVLNSNTGLVTIGTIIIQNIPKDPTGITSSLMNVEMRSYEVTYTRADTGSRIPPPFVRGIFGVATVGGTQTYDSLPILGTDQLDNPPLSDLLFGNGAFDKETGSQVITLNIRLRFFGRTLGGKEVDTAPAFFTVQFVP